ncbi:hypothetical protein WJX82_009000 [Trebouxia sp. C0006]
MADASAIETANAAVQLNKDATQRAASKEPKPVDVQALMNSDPRFIARLIQQLDTQMRNMQDEKRRRQEAIAADTEELTRIDKEIATHVQPRLDALAKALLQKEQMRTELRQQLETQSKTFSSVEKDAQNLLLKALHAGRKVTRENASGLLKEVRGYNAAEPTTKLIKSSRQKAPKPS